jgi:hypothetical protein
MKETDYNSHLENFSVLRSKFDQFLFKYAPVFLISQICITILIFLLGSDNPFGLRYTFRWFEMIFYLFAMLVLIVEVYVTRDFFENIQRTFVELMKRNIINRPKNNITVLQRFGLFLAEFEEKLSYRIPLFLSSIIEVIILVVLQRSRLFPIIFLPENYPVSALTLNFLTIFVPMTIAGYMISVAVWKCFITGYFVHRFSNIFEITVQPSHPDKAGGLKPLGDLIFSMALITIVASLALSILTIASQINNTIYKILISAYLPSSQVQAPFYLYSTEWLAKGSLAVAIILSFVVFVLPIISTHRRMRSEKINLLSSLTEVGNKITELEKQIKKVNLDYKKRNEAFAEIASLSKIYELANKTPVWPFDRDILIKFFTPQVISLLSLLGIIQPIVDAISSWVK